MLWIMSVSLEIFRTDIKSAVFVSRTTKKIVPRKRWDRCFALRLPTAINWQKQKKHVEFVINCIIIIIKRLTEIILNSFIVYLNSLFTTTNKKKQSTSRNYFNSHHTTSCFFFVKPNACWNSMFKKDFFFNLRSFFLMKRINKLSHPSVTYTPLAFIKPDVTSGSNQTDKKHPRCWMFRRKLNFIQT